MSETKLSKRAEKLLVQVRKGKWYPLVGSRPIPKAMAELEEAGLVKIMGRVAVIKAAYVPVGSQPFVPEKLPDV